jgi:hypothetical protein
MPQGRPVNRVLFCGAFLPALHHPITTHLWAAERQAFEVVEVL